MGEYTAVTAQRLKELRLDRGISSPEKLKKVLEEQTGVSLSRDSLRGYEVQDPKSGKSNSCNDGMSAETLRTLAQFYGVSADYILGFDVPKTANPNIAKMAELTGLSCQAIQILKESNTEMQLQECSAYMRYDDMGSVCSAAIIALHDKDARFMLGAALQAEFETPRKLYSEIASEYFVERTCRIVAEYILSTITSRDVSKMFFQHLGTEA